LKVAVSSSSIDRPTGDSDLAAELVRLQVDVIVAVVTQASLAAKNATNTIPVVMLAVGDPVGAGLVTSLARPGGNVTGTSRMSVEAAGKTLELLKNVVPKLRLVGVLWNPANPVFETQMVKETEAAARSLAIQLRMLAARDAKEIDRAFEVMTNERAEALIVIVDPVFIEHRTRLAALATTSRLPSVSGFRDYVEAGGLMAFAADFSEIGRRAATYVDKILKGAKPADLPVEQPTKFELVINLKTAKALGLTIPPSLLARADEVIE
jgi:putative ABC transport system substrate-binding protein